MTNKNLIPLQKGTERTREIARLGGMKKSSKKSFAAHIREIRKKGLTDRIYKELNILMDDPNVDMVGILIAIHQLDKVNMPSEQKIPLVLLMIKWSKLWYGDEPLMKPK